MTCTYAVHCRLCLCAPELLHVFDFFLFGSNALHTQAGTIAQVVVSVLNASVLGSRCSLSCSGMSFTLVSGCTAAKQWQQCSPHFGFELAFPGTFDPCTLQFMHVIIPATLELRVSV